MPHTDWIISQQKPHVHRQRSSKFKPISNLGISLQINHSEDSRKVVFWSHRKDRFPEGEKTCRGVTDLQEEKKAET